MSRRRIPNVLWRAALGALVALCQSASPVTAQPDDLPGELQVKAVFLFNFARFVEWPADAAADEPFTIGIVGNDPFGPLIDEATRGERVNGRPIAVRRLRPSDDLRRSKILFVSGSDRRRIDEVLAAVRDAPVLTVGDADDFAARGGVIRFVKRQYRVGFQINPDAAARARLRISSRLLALAQIVPTTEQ